MKKQSEILKEELNRGKPGFPFQIYSGYPFTSTHWHNEIELIYIEYGELNININGNEYIGKKDDIFIVNKNELHSMSFNKKDTVHYALVFDLSMLFFTEEDIFQKQFISPIWENKIRFYNKLDRKPYFNEIFNKAILYNSQKNSGYMLATKAVLLEFLSLLISENQYYTVDGTGENKNKNLLLKNIILYIEENSYNKITLEEISKNFNMSPKYFCKFFKSNFKKTLIEYINAVRVEQAIFLLNKNEKSITEISLLCGFSNASYFARVFKKITGHTPSFYTE